MGALLPFGEHKGYGLALMCDLLAGALAGGGTNRPETQVSDTIINSMLSIVIDPAALTNATGWKAEADALCDWVKSSPTRAGFDGVMVPGEPERRTRAEREREGFPLDRNTWQQLLEAAHQARLQRRTSILRGAAAILNAAAACPISGARRGCSSMVEQKLPKLTTRVRFPSPAPAFLARTFSAGRSSCDGVRSVSRKHSGYRGFSPFLRIWNNRSSRSSLRLVRAREALGGLFSHFSFSEF